MLNTSTVSLLLLSITRVSLGDGSAWINRDDLPVVGAAVIVPDDIIAGAADTAYIPVEDNTNTKPVESPAPDVSTVKPSDSTQTTTNESSTTTASTTTTQEPPKPYGCTSILWGEGAKFCWRRCNTSSTSTFWNTWCFTTNGNAADSNSTKVACDQDDKCQDDWPCKSSCGMFSPHWDRSHGEAGEEFIEPINDAKHNRK